MLADSENYVIFAMKIAKGSFDENTYVARFLSIEKVM
jgi:hypothetical protein